MDVGWALTDGVDFTFPVGAYVPAGGYALVVPIDPATFRTTYDIDAAVPIYGPFENDTRLANGGERVALSRPGDPEVNQPPPGETPPYVPYIEIEKVSYNDAAPWPTEPDGLGPSLERVAPDLYANDPAHWEASDDAGGTPGAPNQAAVPPWVETVVLNPHPERTVRSVSEVEPSGIGVETVEITFSEAVTFTADAVTVQRVYFDGGSETVDHTFGAGEVTVDGSGTAVMTVTVADAATNAADTWIKVTLSDDPAALVDAEGLALDGEPRLDAAGLGYLYDAADDLPTGDGVAGGEAVFYVGSLRADLGGYLYGPPDLAVDYWDLLLFTNTYQAGSLDADYGGYLYGPPDGVIDYWDLVGFTNTYQATTGTALSPLPVDGTLSAGGPTALALSGSGGTAGEDAGEATVTTSSEPALLTSDEDGTSDGAATDDATTDGDVLPTSTTGGTDAAAAPLGLDPVLDASAPDLWTPPTDTSTTDTADATLDPADALAGPALDVAL
jgi:hypothetical protein